ncbi:uncharacterized protein [Musca autumnalis]|uniref:uncharacterized protein n=1 Tax=Musca autumnalis TaxID=221902 RepID=UPI003CE89FED
MDSNVNTKLKERRERQPNWTEPEKQLLMSLTQLHRPILENKGCDSITMKRKSQAWDNIALHMKKAGYNRSKEKLKQQLGRIRSANRVKEVGVKGFPNNSLNSSACLDSSQDNHKQIMDHIQNEINIKSERNSSTDYENEENGPNHQLQKMFKSADTELQNCDRFELDKRCEMEVNKKIAVVDFIAQDNVIQNKTASTASNASSSESSDNENQFDLIDGPTTDQNRIANNSQIKLTGIHVPNTRERRLRQIHLYRIAVERERLRSLKAQQKRDRIMHRKDIQIQNLKLNILRNLCNQKNRDPIIE